MREMEIDSEDNMVKDNVNHPSHYTGKYECIDVMADCMGIELTKDFCLGNAFKYLYRHRRKNGLEDIRKAQWYINKYLELSERTEKQPRDSWNKLKEMGLLTNISDGSIEHYSLGTYKGKQI